MDSLRRSLFNDSQSLEPLIQALGELPGFWDSIFFRRAPIPRKGSSSNSNNPVCGHIGVKTTYLQTWRLQLSHTKTVTTAFHLNNREAKRELDVYNNGKRLPFCPVPTYLGVKLDRSLTFPHHLQALRKKLTTRVALMRRLAGSGWGAGAKTLRTAALSLVYSTA